MTALSSCDQNEVTPSVSVFTCSPAGTSRDDMTVRHAHDFISPRGLSLMLKWEQNRTAPGLVAQLGMRGSCQP